MKIDQIEFADHPESREEKAGATLTRRFWLTGLSATLIATLLPDEAEARGRGLKLGHFKNKSRGRKMGRIRGRGRAKGRWW